MSTVLITGTPDDDLEHVMGLMTTQRHSPSAGALAGPPDGNHLDRQRGQGPAQPARAGKPLSEGLHHGVNANAVNHLLCIRNRAQRRRFCGPTCSKAQAIAFRACGKRHCGLRRVTGRQPKAQGNRRVRSGRRQREGRSASRDFGRSRRTAALPARQFARLPDIPSSKPVPRRQSRGQSDEIPDSRTLREDQRGSTTRPKSLRTMECSEHYRATSNKLWISCRRKCHSSATRFACTTRESSALTCPVAAMASNAGRYHWRSTGQPTDLARLRSLRGTQVYDPGGIRRIRERSDQRQWLYDEINVFNPPRAARSF